MASNIAPLKKTVVASPALAPQSVTADIDRALSQLSTTFNPLHQDFVLDFHISAASDGYVYLSIALPEGMTRFFVQLLESMHGFFRCLDHKARSAVATVKAHDPAEIARAEERHAAFKERVCATFDAFRGQGADVKEAVSRTNAALKAEKCTWATYETVLAVLRASGRFRKGSRSKGPSNPQGGAPSRAESVAPTTKGGPASSLGIGQDEAG